MKFVHPEILWALGALAIPVIVHLFNFRRFKKVLFPNVSFLKEIHQETQSKSKLKHLLILLTRMLAMTCIIFAFAQPYIPLPGDSTKPGGTAVSIYVDNSFSMEGEGQDGRLLELAKNKAIEIAGAFSPSDKFQLLTCDFEGRHQRLVSREEVIGLIQEVKVSAVSRKISEVVLRQRDVLNASGQENKRSFLLTDLQQTVTDLTAISNDTTIRFNIVPDIAESISNVFIDSVWFDSPVRQMNQPEILHARVVNTGNESRDNIPVQLSVNGQQKSVSTVSVGAETNVVLDLTYTNTDAGFKKCSLVIDDQSVTKDDAYFFSYNVAEKLNVLDLRGRDVQVESVRNVFSDDPAFNFLVQSEASPDFGSFANQNLIILDQLKGISSGLTSELEKFIQSGGSILVIPATEIITNEYNDLLSKLGLGQFSGKVIDAEPTSSAEDIGFNSGANGTQPSSNRKAEKGEDRVINVDYDHYIFRNAFEKTIGNVDLPKVMNKYVIGLPVRSTAVTMMTLQSGSPFMVSNKVNGGNAYVLAVSLDPAESNFTQHAFFPATLLRIAEFSQPEYPLAYTLGSDQAIIIRSSSAVNEETFRLSDKTSGNEFIPEHRNAGGNIEIYVHNDLNIAGNYELSRGIELVNVTSFNYDRAESDTRSVGIDAVNAWINGNALQNWTLLDGNIESVAASADNLVEGKKYWFTMIVWALILLAIEILLIKFWR